MKNYCARGLMYPAKETKKEIKTSSGTRIHFTAGAIIERNGKYLLMDRVNPPFGWAGAAGHIDEGETPEQTVRREVYEEVGLTVTDCTLVLQTEDIGHACSHGVDIHKWHVYKCDVHGEVDFTKSKEEASDVRWFSSEEIKALKLEPIWSKIFEELKII